MPVFALDQHLIFPHPVLREPEGIMAAGGDLTVDRLLLAYRWGIFPWYQEEDPILWWWTSPRLMVRPAEIHISHSLKTQLNHPYRITWNQHFDFIMKQCGTISRKGQEGTWITEDMLAAYIALHEAGHAHSVEVWEGNEIIGGLYGVVYGKIFSGESMFALKSNASKIAFVHLAQKLGEHQFEWIDCQQDTPHMQSLGGKLIGEEDYLDILRRNQRFVLNNRLEPVRFI